MALDLINLIGHEVKNNGDTSLPVHFQVLCTLRFLAEGAFQKGVGNDCNHAMSQASVSRCIDNVVNAILSIRNNYIKFPSTHDERILVSDG